MGDPNSWLDCTPEYTTSWFVSMNSPEVHDEYKKMYPRPAHCALDDYESLAMSLVELVHGGRPWQPDGHDRAKLRIMQGYLDWIIENTSSNYFDTTPVHEYLFKIL